MAKVCNCKEEINDRLKEKFGEEVFLHGYDLLSGKSGTPFEHKEGKRKTTSYVFHTYCPFCGKKYDEEGKS